MEPDKPTTPQPKQTEKPPSHHPADTKQDQPAAGNGKSEQSPSDQKPHGTVALFKHPKILGVAGLVLVIIGASVLVTILDKKEASPVKPYAPETAVVEISQTGFMPQTITVKTGTVVTWTNKTGSGRQIAAEPFPTGDSLPELKNEEPIEDGDSYSFTFEKPGTYNYYDSSSPETVKGTVTVK